MQVLSAQEEWIFHIIKLEWKPKAEVWTITVHILRSLPTQSIAALHMSLADLSSCYC